MEPLPRYAALYVVSDLHMGGETGFQMFGQGELLAETIGSLPLKKHEVDGSVALVLNGDIVDFLAEPRARYLDPAGAIGKLTRICRDPAFSPVWDALAQFVRQDGRELILVLGNHDVELALPDVREWLAQRLSGGDPSARGRIRFHLDGAGFACEVGGRRVLCVHGNEVDTWNLVDHRQLLEVQRAANRGTAPEPWDANAGTRLVVDVMNAIKRRYPMVDLLKPETEAVLPILAALDPDPDKLRLMARILRVAATLGRDGWFKRIGLLSAEEDASGQGPSGEELLGGLLAQTLDGGTLEDHDPVLSAYRALQEGEGPGIPGDPGATDTLGFTDWFPGLDTEARKLELLRKALRFLLADDPTFQIDHADETFRQLAAVAGDQVDFLIAGHTHLRRALPLPGGGFYFNTGTWARLIELPKAVLDDGQAFGDFYKALQSPLIAELEKKKVRGRRIVLNRPTIACIIEGDRQVAGELFDPASGRELHVPFTLPRTAR